MADNPLSRTASLRSYPPAHLSSKNHARRWAFLPLAVLALAVLALAMTLFGGGPAPAEAQTSFTITVMPGGEILNVSWNGVQGAETYYVDWKSPVQSYNTGAASTRSVAVPHTSTSAGHRYTITGLTPGTAYTVRVRSVPASGSERTSNEVTAAPHRKVRVNSNTAGDALIVRWDKYDTEGLHRTEIQWKSGGQDYNESDRKATIPHNAVSPSEHSITGLEPGAVYTVLVNIVRTGVDEPVSIEEVTGKVTCPTAPETIFDNNTTIVGQWSSACYINYFNFQTGALGNIHLQLSAVDANGKEVAVELFLRKGEDPVDYSTLDFDTLKGAGNNRPHGIWSDGMTMWVSDTEDDKIYAYRMGDSSRDTRINSYLDFDTLAAAGNRDAVGLWSDGRSMWVADLVDAKIYAYDARERSRGKREPHKDFNTLAAAGNGDPTGLWSDGRTMWVADNVDRKAYAYRMSDKRRDSDKDIDFGDFENVFAIWSDGETMWVVSAEGSNILAFRLSDGRRNMAKEFTASGANTPVGMWSDGQTMWVMDSASKKIYAYGLHDGKRGGAGALIERSVKAYRGASPGLRSSDNAWVLYTMQEFIEDNPTGDIAQTYSYEARLSLAQTDRLQRKLLVEGRWTAVRGWIKDNVYEPVVAYPVTFTLHHNVPPAQAVGKLSKLPFDLRPKVSDFSALKNYKFEVGDTVNITFPEAIEGSGNGGTYTYEMVNPPSGLSFSASTRSLTGTTVKGKWVMRYVIHDGDENRDVRDDAFFWDMRFIVGEEEDEGGSSMGQLPPNTLPGFDSSVVTALTVAENSPAGTNVGAPVAATDPDEYDTLTYSLTGDDAAKFAIDGAGQITTIAGVTYDYERRSYLPEPAYSLTVRVTDISGGGAGIPVTVTLTDVDDAPAQNLPPEFHEGTSTTREVAEDSPAGTNVGKPITAYDANKDALEYIGFDGADGAAFNLDSSTGQITTKDGVTYDYAAKSSYTFMALVQESDTAEGHMTGISVTVNLTEAAAEGQANGEGQGNGQDDGTGQQQSNTESANTVPAFDAGIVTALSLDENSAAGTNVGSPVTATDPDEGDVVTYSLSGTDAASFDIGSSTGQITTKTNVTYDYETKSSYSLAVDASDGKGGTASTPVTVDLNNVNEAPSFAGSSTTRKVAENSAAGTNVGKPITATDPDAGDTLTYSLSGTDAASFDIGGSTGQITTKAGVTYNHEAKPSYSLAVEATDGKGLSDSIAVTVSLNDVAEAPTVSDATQFKNHAATVGQTFSLVLPAADANSGDGGPYEYLLWHRGAGQNFMDQAINGLSFNAATRTLSGTPTAAGVWKLSYVVHDDDDDRSVGDRFRARTNLQITVSQ